MMTLSGNILTPSGFVQGALVFGPTGRIESIQGSPVSEAAAKASGLPWVLPGFIDLHAHGAGGRDIMEGGDAATVVSQMHARHGTTSMLGTTMTAPMEDLVVAMSAMTEVCQQRAPGGARLLGVHLEGPYINEGRLGAQPPFARPVQSDELAALNALAPIRLITLVSRSAGQYGAD